MNKVAIDYVIHGLHDQNLFQWDPTAYTNDPDKEKITTMLADYGWTWDQFIAELSSPKFQKRFKKAIEFAKKKHEAEQAAKEAEKVDEKLPQ